MNTSAADVSRAPIPPVRPLQKPPKKKPSLLWAMIVIAFPLVSGALALIALVAGVIWGVSTYTSKMAAWTGAPPEVVGVLSVLGIIAAVAVVGVIVEWVKAARVYVEKRS